MAQKTTDPNALPENGERVQLEERDAELAVLLASGTPVAVAARTVGYARGTVYNRLADPVFQRALAELRSRMTQELLNRLLKLDEAALKTLEDGLARKVPPTRLTALRIFLETRHKLVEEVELRTRLERLEEAVKERGPVEGSARKLPG